MRNNTILINTVRYIEIDLEFCAASYRKTIVGWAVVDNNNDGGGAAAVTFNFKIHKKIFGSLFINSRLFIGLTQLCTSLTARSWNANKIKSLKRYLLNNIGKFRENVHTSLRIDV